MSSRSEARQRVMQALYAFTVSENEAAHCIDQVLRPALQDDADAFGFAKQLFLRTLGRQDEIDAIVMSHTDNWDFDRIAPVDKALLRMATCELLAFEDIPPKVSIDEAIEIAKAYSTEKSSAFINGVLDAVLAQLKNEERLNKSGRGLVGLSSVPNGTTS